MELGKLCERCPKSRMEELERSERGSDREGNSLERPRDGERESSLCKSWEGGTEGGGGRESIGNKIKLAWKVLVSSLECAFSPSFSSPSFWRLLHVRRVKSNLLQLFLMEGREECAAIEQLS